MPNIIRTGSSNKKLSLSAKTTDVLTGKTFSVDGKNVLVGTIPSLGATTYIPKTTDQTIASGRYISGVQTIKGDTNLVASNIASGKSIFGVAGTFEGGGYEDKTFSIPINFRTLAEYPIYSIQGNNNHRTLKVSSTKKIKGVEYCIRQQDNSRLYMYVYYPTTENMVSKDVLQKRLLDANYSVTDLWYFIMNDSYHTVLQWDCVIWKDDYNVDLRLSCSVEVALTVTVRLFY